MLTIFIDISIVHIQKSNTVVQQINLFIMSNTLYSVVNTVFQWNIGQKNKK